MKTHSLLTFSLCALLVSSAVASPTWYTGSYDPATWEPAAVNVLHGIEAYTGPTMYPGDNHGATATTTIPLTDGAVPGANINIADIVGVKSGDLKWNFDGPANLSEVRIYSRWFDGGRDGIHIKKVAYKVLNGDNSWIELAGDNNRVQYGLNDNNTSGALYAILKEPDGSFLCTDAIALYIQFSGAQDNDGTGYVEIEAVSESAAPAISCTPSVTRVSATLAGAVPSCGTTATSVTLSYAVAPRGEPLPAYTAYGASLARGATFSIPVSGLRWGTEYDYSLYAVNNEGEETFLSGTFTTQPEECGAITAGPGLWEVRYDGNGHDWTPDVWAIEEGLDVHQRHRELGAEMAYTTSSHTSTINGQTYSWINNAVFAYVGYIYLQGNTTYTFQSSIDDYAYIKIGDSFVHDSPGYSARFRTSMSTGDAGWYPIEIRLGDTGGGYGPFNGDPGLCYSIDNGATWNTFMDPGDGSFLRSSMVNPLSILSVVNTGTALRLEVSFANDIAGCPFTACAAETYGAETASAWTTTSLDPIGATETYRSFTLPYAAGTEFVRFFVTFNGTDYWSETLVLADYAAVNPAAPTFTLGGVLSTTQDSADIAVNIVSAGDGHSTCDLVLAYGTDPAALTSTNVFAGKTVGNTTITLGNLMPNRLYYATLRAENNEASAAETPVFSFQTQDFNVPSAPYLPASLPGLWQGVFTNDTENYLENTGKYDLDHADSVNREPGAVMAYINNRTSPAGHTCAFDGVERNFKWTGDTTYAYSGWIWLDATKYVFGAYFWDYVYLKIDNDVLFNQKIDWGVPVRSRTYETAGWHRFELRGSNKGNEGDPAREGSSYGGAGDCYTAGANIAISYSTDPAIIAIVEPLIGGGDPGINGSAYPMREVTWSQFIDDGSGTFLRTANPLRSIAVSGLSTAGGTLSANLAFGDENPGTYDLRIAYGATLGGDDPASWTDTAAVATIPAATDTYAYSGLAGAGTTVKYARFYFTDGVDVRWGDNLYLPDPSEVALDTELTVDAHLGDTLLLSGGLVSSGSGATAAVSALVATQADLSDAIVWPLGSFAAGDDIVATLHEADTSAARYIQPGSDYYVILIAEATNGETDRTSVVAVTTPAGADLSDTVSTVCDMWTATFSGTLTEVGAGNGTTVTLLTGPSSNSLTNTASTVMTAAGPVSFTVEFPNFGEVFYRLRAENACETASWTDETPIASVTPTDTSTYTWKYTVANGDWSDAGNWICSVDDQRLSYPNSTGCTVSFAECTDEVTVHVDGMYSVKTLNLSVSNLEITFVGANTNDSGVVVLSDNVSMAAGETILLDGVMFHFPGLAFVNNSTLRLQNAAHLECLNNPNMDKENCRVELFSDSTLVAPNGFRIRGNGNVVHIEDSTFSTAGGNFNPSDNASSQTVTVEFAGSHPKLTAYSIIPANSGIPSSGILPVFRFNIPLGGYDETPITTQHNFPREVNGGYAIHFEVIKKSACYACGGSDHIKLVEGLTNRSINANFLDFADQPRPEQTRYYLTYGANDSLDSGSGNPTGLWVEVKGTGSTVIMMK